VAVVGAVSRWGGGRDRRLARTVQESDYRWYREVRAPPAARTSDLQRLGPNRSVRYDLSSMRWSSWGFSKLCSLAAMAIGCSPNPGAVSLPAVSSTARATERQPSSAALEVTPGDELNNDARGPGAVARARDESVESPASSPAQREPVVVAAARQSPLKCSYDMYNWSVTKKRAVNRRTEDHRYEAVTANERDPNDERCTVCEQDQVQIDPSEFGLDVKSFKVCWAYADEVKQALRRIQDDGGFDTLTLTGYRPGRTRGRIEEGLRMELSNHSYGTAIDINAKYNGLYRQCSVDVENAASIDSCRLGVGGAWDPDKYPRRSIEPEGVVVRMFKEETGWKWGGALEGRTKDFMHFSLTGY